MASVPLFPRAHLSKCSSFSGALTQTSKTLAHFLKTAGMQYFSFLVFSPHEKRELFPEKLGWWFLYLNLNHCAWPGSLPAGASGL